MIKGVNLGNWLVLEKWMSPGLFAGTSAEDESHLCAALDDTTKAQLYKQHRDTYITERDFAYLASKGISAVRIPVPFFVFGGYPPYVSCVEYLDRAMEWATAYDIKVFLELHTVPGSQNGFDNGGICGVCTWHKHPEDVAFAIDVLRRLTARYHQHRAFWAIGVLNETVSEQLWVEMDIPRRYPGTDPILASESGPVPTEFLKQFYRDAYAAIRSESESVLVVFHDGFRLEEWGDYFE
jgi:glucan 1,3-beta-glucosidase